jgi:DNA gyrase/topoisomerase IV subunit A
VLATKNGLVKKTRLEEFDSNRSGGIIAINLREDDELVGAALAASENDLLLVSKNAQAIRFNATDEALRPMGRATSGVIGMRFGDSDELLAMEVVRDGHGRFGRYRRRVCESGHRSRSIRCRVGAARVCSPRKSRSVVVDWWARCDQPRG